MLVLSRKTQEAVIVGTSDDGDYLCKVTVLKVAGDRVQLGFEADRAVPVHRSELWGRLQVAEAAGQQTPLT